MMPCETITLPGGISAIVCTRRKPRRRCSCGSGQFTSLLCDHPKPRGGTCDKPLCDGCAVVVGTDRHHCPGHPQVLPPATEAPRQAELGL